jgi:hypothetical protein
MITDKLYKELVGYKDMLNMFKNTGEPLGDLNPLFRMHKEATGRDLKIGCGSCVGEVLVDCLNMIERYERT